ncbi:protein Smaug 2 [Trichuris trichiura]|uniref:Protein Smaug 2 n=1 Tax=Trichuris trichiura TaxID=36087 RepID=A0A077YVY3_TRITR|nr:protein Smaug 2 [Trichuris trichiura]
MNSTMCDWSQLIDRPVRRPLFSSNGRPLTTDPYSPQSPTRPDFRPLSSLSPGSSSTSSNGTPMGESLFNPPARRQWLPASPDPSDAVTQAMSMLNFSSSDESVNGNELWSYLCNLSHRLEPAVTSRRTTCRPSDSEKTTIDPYFLNALLVDTDASNLGEMLLRLSPCITYMTAEAKQVYVAAIKQFVTAVFTSQVSRRVAARVFYSFAKHPCLLPDVRLLFKRLLDLLLAPMNPMMNYGTEMSRPHSEPTVLASCRTAATNGWTFPADVQPPPMQQTTSRRQSPVARDGGHFAYNAFPQSREPLVDYAARSTVGSSLSYPANSGMPGMCPSMPTNKENEEQCPGEEDIFTLMSLFNSRNVPTDERAQREGDGQSASSASVPAGMRDVPQWLKILRLHKYAELFVGLSYEEMLSLDERSRRFEAITSGARRKLLLSIQRLRRRATTLKEIEMGGFLKSGSMIASLTELKAIAESPICPYKEIVGNVGEAKVDGFNLLPDEVDDRNIPAHLTRVLGKACTQLKAFSELDEESISMCCEILDHCILHEAFTSNQKKRLNTWSKELRRAWFSYQKNAEEQQLAMERPIRARRGRGSSNQTLNNEYREPCNEKRNFGRRRNKESNQRSYANNCSSRASMGSSWRGDNGRNDRKNGRRNQTDVQRGIVAAKNCVQKVPLNRKNRSSICHNGLPRNRIQQINDESKAANDQNPRLKNASFGMLIRDGWTYSKERNSNHFAFNVSELPSIQVVRELQCEAYDVVYFLSCCCTDL